MDDIFWGFKKWDLKKITLFIFQFQKVFYIFLLNLNFENLTLL